MTNILETVLNRGYATDEEYDVLEKEIGFTRFWNEDQDERFWGIKLTEDRFILANNPLDFWGCPDVIGLVGVYTEGSRGDKMLFKDSLELFKQTDRHVTVQESE